MSDSSSGVRRLGPRATRAGTPPHSSSPPALRPAVLGGSRSRARVGHHDSDAAPPQTARCGVDTVLGGESSATTR
jgi:hypothetical protein